MAIGIQDTNNPTTQGQGSQTSGQSSQNPNSQGNQQSTLLPATGGQRLSQKGTGFTNINRILSANQGNSLGNTIQQGITSNADKIRQGIQSAGQNFQQQVAQNTLDTPENAQIRANVLQNIAQGQGVQQADIDAFSKFRAGAYGGPTGLKNADLYAQQGAEAEQIGSALGSEGGRQAILQRFIGGPSYTQGQQTLDTLLLGNSGNQIRQAKQAALGLQSQAINQSNLASNLANKANESAKNFGSDTTNLLNTQQNNLNTADQKLLEDTANSEAANIAKYNQLQQDLTQGQISKEDAMRIGGQGFVDFINNNPDLYSITPQDLATKYLTTKVNGLPTNVSDVISQKDAVQANALAQLSGQQNPYDLAKIGTFAPSTQTFDYAKMQDQIAQDKAAQDAAFKKHYAAAILNEGMTNDASFALNRLKDVGALDNSSILRITNPDDVSELARAIHGVQNESSPLTGQWSTPSTLKAGYGNQNFAGASLEEASSNLKNALTQSDNVAKVQYQNDPELQKQYPNYSDYLVESRLNTLQQYGIKNFEELGHGVADPFIRNNLNGMSADQILANRNAAFGQKLKFKDNASS